MWSSRPPIVEIRWSSVVTERLSRGGSARARTWKPTGRYDRFDTPVGETGQRVKYAGAIADVHPVLSGAGASLGTVQSVLGNLMGRDGSGGTGTGRGGRGETSGAVVVIALVCEGREERFMYAHIASRLSHVNTKSQQSSRIHADVDVGNDRRDFSAVENTSNTKRLDFGGPR